MPARRDGHSTYGDPTQQNQRSRTSRNGNGTNGRGASQHRDRRPPRDGQARNDLRATVDTIAPDETAENPVETSLETISPAALIRDHMTEIRTSVATWSDQAEAQRFLGALDEVYEFFETIAPTPEFMGEYWTEAMKNWKEAGVKDTDEIQATVFAGYQMQWSRAVSLLTGTDLASVGFAQHPDKQAAISAYVEYLATLAHDGTVDIDHQVAEGRLEGLTDELTVQLQELTTFVNPDFESYYQIMQNEPALWEPGTATTPDQLRLVDLQEHIFTQRDENELTILKALDACLTETPTAQDAYFAATETYVGAVSSYENWEEAVKAANEGEIKYANATGGVEKVLAKKSIWTGGKEVVADPGNAQFIKGMKSHAEIIHSDGRKEVKAIEYVGITLKEKVWLGEYKYGKLAPGEVPTQNDYYQLKPVVVHNAVLNSADKVADFRDQLNVAERIFIQGGEVVRVLGVEELDPEDARNLAYRVPTFDPEGKAIFVVIDAKTKKKLDEACDKAASAFAKLAEEDPRYVVHSAQERAKRIHTQLQTKEFGYNSWLESERDARLLDSLAENLHDELSPTRPEVSDHIFEARDRYRTMLQDFESAYLKPSQYLAMAKERLRDYGEHLPDYKAALRSEVEKIAAEYGCRGAALKNTALEAYRLSSERELSDGARAAYEAFMANIDYELEMEFSQLSRGLPRENVEAAFSPYRRVEDAEGRAFRSLREQVQTLVDAQNLGERVQTSVQEARAGLSSPAGPVEIAITAQQGDLDSITPETALLANAAIVMREAVKRDPTGSHDAYIDALRVMDRACTLDADIPSTVVSDEDEARWRVEFSHFSSRELRRDELDRRNERVGLDTETIRQRREAIQTMAETRDLAEQVSRVLAISQRLSQDSRAGASLVQVGVELALTDTLGWFGGDGEHLLLPSVPEPEIASHQGFEVPVLHAPRSVTEGPSRVSETFQDIFEANLLVYSTQPLLELFDDMFSVEEQVFDFAAPSTVPSPPPPPFRTMSNPGPEPIYSITPDAPQPDDLDTPLPPPPSSNGANNFGGFGAVPPPSTGS